MDNLAAFFFATHQPFANRLLTHAVPAY